MKDRCERLRSRSGNGPECQPCFQADGFVDNKSRGCRARGLPTSSLYIGRGNVGFIGHLEFPDRPKFPDVLFGMATAPRVAPPFVLRVGLDEVEMSD